MLRRADAIILPIVPNIGAVYWSTAIRSMLENAGVLIRTIPIAVALAMPTRQSMRWSTRSASSLPLSSGTPGNWLSGTNLRLATDAIRRDGLHWSRNLHLLYAEIERRQAEAKSTVTPKMEVTDI